MKQSVLLFIAILISISIYTVIAMVSFEPDKPQPFVFNTPNLPAGVTMPTKDAFATDLSPEEIARNQLIDAKIDDALTSFRNMRETLPQQALETLDILTSQADSGSVPLYFLSAVDPLTNKRRFELLHFEPTRWASMPTGKNTLSCSIQTPPADIIVGNEQNNTLECNLQASTKGTKGNTATGATETPAQANTTQNDHIFLGGPGDDTITDTQGNHVVNGGTGDDTIALGSGRTIIILDAGWGHDQLTVDCKDTEVTPNQLDTSFPIKYPYKTTNFIILSPRLSPKDIYWEGNLLKSKTSDDSLSVNENCFTVVPSAPPAVETAPVAEAGTPTAPAAAP